MNKAPGFLAAGVVGVAALLLGQAWDFYLHAVDPTLAHREGIFAVSNPGHVLLGVGLVLVVVGVLGAAYAALPIGDWWRRSFLIGFLALVVVSGATAGWAASIELSERQRFLAADHAQAVAATHQASSAGVAHAGSAQLTVTAAQLVAAERLYEQTKAAVERYRDLRVAIAAGYQPMEPPDLEIVHYVNRAYFSDADVLKPEHVQSLIYYNSSKGPVLIGAMFIMPRLGMAGPEIGGSLTSWHHHEDLCFDKSTDMVVAFVGDPFFDRPGKASRSCPLGSSNHETPEMLHVWVVDNPAGPFDSDMSPRDLAAVAPG